MIHFPFVSLYDFFMHWPSGLLSVSLRGRKLDHILMLLICSHVKFRLPASCHSLATCVVSLSLSCSISLSEASSEESIVSLKHLRVVKAEKIDCVDIREGCKYNCSKRRMSARCPPLTFLWQTLLYISHLFGPLLKTSHRLVQTVEEIHRNLRKETKIIKYR